MGGVRDLLGARELLGALVERQLRIRLKRSAVGIFLPIVAPMFLLALYAFVFNRVFHVPLRHYPLFLFTGLLPWTFLAQTLGGAVASISSEPELVRRSRFPYELLPISTVVVLGGYFVAALVAFVVYLAARGLVDYPLLVALPLPVVALFLLVSGLSVLLALVDVYNRDLRQVLGNLLTVWFFLAPIVYRPEMARGWHFALRSVDPLNMIVGGFRDILFWHRLSRPGHLALMCGVCVVFFVACMSIFRRFSPELPKDV